MSDCTNLRTAFATRITGEADAWLPEHDAHLAGCPECATALRAELHLDRLLVALAARQRAAARRPRRPARRWLIAAAAAGLLLAVAGTLMLTGRQPPPARGGQGWMVLSGTARLSTGATVGARTALGPGAIVALGSVRLADASGARRLDLASGARARIGDDDGIAMDAGVLTAEVDPGRGLRLRATAPGLAVEVLGTIFRIEADPLGSALTVDRGTVRASNGAATTTVAGGERLVRTGWRAEADPLRRGLVAAWRFDRALDRSGELPADGSGPGLRLLPDALIGPGRRGGGLRPGTIGGAEVVAGAWTPPATGTLALWVRLDTADADHRFHGLVSRLGGGAPPWEFGIGRGRVPEVWAGEVGTRWHRRADLALGSGWHHLALSVSGSTAWLAVDGRMVPWQAGDQDRRGAPSLLGGPDQRRPEYHLGATRAGKEVLRGALDDVLVYDRELTTAELAELAGRP